MKYILLSIFCLLGTITLLAQEEQEPIEKTLIEIKNANRLKAIDNDSVDMKKLIGNVLLQQEDIIFECDSAFLYESSNSIDAFGRVHIQQGDSIDIYADYLKYNGFTKIARLYQNVELQDSTATITSDTLYYYLDEKRAVLFNDVHITDQQVDIYSDSLEYFSTTKKAYLNDSVRLIDKQMLLTADEMDYDFNENIGTYTGNGVLTNKDTKLTSEQGVYEYDTKDVTFVDSVYVKSPTYEINTDTLEYNTTTEFASFTGNTTIINQGNTINCLEGYYDKQKDIINVSGETVLNNEGQVLAADSLYFEKESGKGYAFGDVFWEDTTKNMTITCKYMEYHEPSTYLLATDSLLFKQIIGEDTLFLTADTLSSITMSRYPTPEDANKITVNDSITQGVRDQLLSTESGNLGTNTIDTTAITKDEGEPKDSTDIVDGEGADDLIDTSPGNLGTNTLVETPPQKTKRQKRREARLARREKRKKANTIQITSNHEGHNDDNHDQKHNPTETAQTDSLQTPIDSLTQKGITIDSLQKIVQDTSNLSDSLTIFHAYQNVRFYKKDFQGICDSLVYTTNDSSFRFYKDPVLWSEQSQLTADTILLTTIRNRPNNIRLLQSALIGNESGLNIYNQLKGDSILGHFKESQLYRIEILENAESVYYAQNDADEYYGVNQAKSQTMMIYVEEEEVQKIKFYKKPEATFYPITKTDPYGFKLGDFKWRIEERPMSWRDLLK